MRAVEYCSKSGPYCRQVSDVVLLSVPLTGKNSSDGLRMTWYIQLSGNHTLTTIDRTISALINPGARRNARETRRRERTPGHRIAMRMPRLAFLRRFRARFVRAGGRSVTADYRPRDDPK